MKLCRRDRLLELPAPADATPPPTSAAASPVGSQAARCLWPLIMPLPSATAALLERERELSELGQLVDETCAGRGRLALVEGPPGIGKTRLLDALRAHASAGGMAVLSARASELDRDFPFGVVRQLFEPLV